MERGNQRAGNDPFPLHLRPIIDRAIRYADFLIQRTRNPSAPLANYHYFNNNKEIFNTVPDLDDETKYKDQEDEEGNNKTWYDWWQETFNQLGGSRLLHALNLEKYDPLTNIMYSNATHAFYNWKIPIDPHYPEHLQLGQDFNSNPPPFISYQIQLLENKKSSDKASQARGNKEHLG